MFERFCLRAERIAAGTSINMICVYDLGSFSRETDMRVAASGPRIYHAHLVFVPWIRFYENISAFVKKK